jgi:hypothetical protein
MCHRENRNGQIWVDRLDLIPPGEGSLCQHLSNFNLKGVASDEQTRGKKLGEARQALLSERDRISFSSEVGNRWIGLQDRIRFREWVGQPADLVGHQSEVNTSADYSDEIDALARAVWLIKERERPAPTLKSSGGRAFTI